jgi:NAD(P)H-flavin reductase
MESSGAMHSQQMQEASAKGEERSETEVANPYVPYPVKIDHVVTETEDGNLKTFRLVFINEADEEGFSFLPGQFAELSIAGKGEIPIGIASSPTERGSLLFTVNKVGVVTTQLHQMGAGEVMGIRGPLGNWYPWEQMKGKHVVIIGGGFAFTTLRSSIVYMLEPANRGDFEDITVVYGARSPGMLLYREELAAWEQRDDLNMHITVDATDDPDWQYNVGFVPAITEQKITTAHNAIALVCGPPIMIRFTQPVLEKLGFAPEHIILSLEMRMKCGIGMCGRCNIGHNYVCIDGPVFSLAQLKLMPPEY